MRVKLTNRGEIHAGRGGAAGFTLVEYLVSFFIATFTVMTIATGYIVAMQRSEFITASGAAQSLVDDQLELVRGARWDLYSSPPVTGRVEALAGSFAVTLSRLAVTGATGLPATLTTSVTSVSTDPPLLQVRVECVWSYANRGPFTNTVVTYRAPDT